MGSPQQSKTMMMWIARLLCVVTVASAMPANENNGRAFSLFSVVTFPNNECTTTSTTKSQGVCKTAEECTADGGVASGNCASGFGVCCSITITEAATTKTITHNITYIQNKGFPTAVGSTAPLAALTGNAYTVKGSSSICFVRLDFDTVVMRAPSAAGGACQTGEAITLASPSTKQLGVTNLCGTLTGAHIYIPNDDDSTTLATVNINHDKTSFARTWKIKVSQIECDNPSAPPDEGCRQYFMGAGGTISSFGSVGTANSFLSSQQYTVCIRPEAGMKCVKYRETRTSTTPDAFDLQSPTPTTSGTAEVGASCTTAYIVIPSTKVTIPRYCGDVLAAVDAATAASPVTADSFTLRVVAATTSSGSGFQLRYAQQPTC